MSLFLLPLCHFPHFSVSFPSHRLPRRGQIPPSPIVATFSPSFAALPSPPRRPFVSDLGVRKNLHGFKARRPHFSPPTFAPSFLPSGRRRPRPLPLSSMLPPWLLRRGSSYQDLAPPPPSSTNVAAASPPSLQHSSLNLVVAAYLFFVLRHHRTFPSSLLAATANTTTYFLFDPHGKPLPLFSIPTEEIVLSLGGLEATRSEELIIDGREGTVERESEQRGRETRKRESKGERERTERERETREQRG